LLEGDALLIHLNRAFSRGEQLANNGEERRQLLGTLPRFGVPQTAQGIVKLADGLFNWYAYEIIHGVLSVSLLSVDAWVVRVSFGVCAQCVLRQPLSALQPLSCISIVVIDCRDCRAPSWLSLDYAGSGAYLVRLLQLKATADVNVFNAGFACCGMLANCLTETG
jgi:hypothetical protein